MSLLFHNGVIHSLDANNSKYDAIVTHESKIAAVGDYVTLSREFPEAIRVDLMGGHILPGFVDAHCHVYGMGERLTKPRLEGTSSKEDIIAALRPITGNSGWIISRGWDQTKWPEPIFPHRRDLDQSISDTQPIALTRIDGHALWCNSMALEIAGIDRNTIDPLGGAILHDADGEPTGMLLDEAMKLVESKIPLPTPDDLVSTLRTGLQYFLKCGHVAIHEMGVSAELWRAYEMLYVRAGETLPQAYVFLDMTKETGKQLFLSQDFEEENSPISTKGRRTESERMGGRLTFAGIKLYLDGALGSRGAQLFEDYSDDLGNRGLALMEDDEVIELMRRAEKMAVQIAVHAIGDRANARALDLFERAGVIGGRSVLRIEHAQIVRDADVRRFVERGIFAIVQPAFYKSDREWAVNRLGAVRLKTAYRWRSLIDAGVKFVASSDAPIEVPDPIEGIRLLTGRDGMHDNEALSSVSAFRAYAQTAHELTGDRNTSGELASGFRADLTILDREMSRVVEVIVDGKWILAG